MSIMNAIKSAQIEARKAKDESKASALTTLIGEANMIGKNAGNRETTDAEVLSVIKKFIKNIDETVEILSKDLAPNSVKIQALQAEKVLLSNFLPKQMSESEVKVAIEQIIAKMNLSGPKAMGAIMKEMKSQYDGSYDGSMVSRISKELLS